MLKQELLDWVYDDHKSRAYSFKTKYFYMTWNNFNRPLFYMTEHYSDIPVGGECLNVNFSNEEIDDNLSMDCDDLCCDFIKKIWNPKKLFN